MKYYFGVFCVFQTALIIGKIFEIKLVADQSWWWVLRPFLAFTISGTLTFLVYSIVDFIKSKTGK